MNLLLGSVYQQLGQSHHAHIKENRAYLDVILDVILYLNKQELALRGDSKGPLSENKGNFLELLDLLAERDAQFRSKYIALPGNAKYTHLDIQYDLISSAVQVVINKIKTELLEAKFWAVMADEVRDCSCKEQMAICIRYYFSGMLNERCVSIVETKKLDATSLTTIIQGEREVLSLDSAKAVAQCYD